MQKEITYCGQRVTLACDGNCRKAWGINNRPMECLSENPDDYALHTDQETGEAPRDPGTYEGGQGKPNPADPNATKMNKWCARECERSVMVPVGKEIILPDFSKRQHNIPIMT